MSEVAAMSRSAGWREPGRSVKCESPRFRRSPCLDWRQYGQQQRIVCGRGSGRAHALIYDKLPKRTKTLLALPEEERTKLIRDRKKLLATRAKAKTENETNTQAKPKKT